jgi:hypothetical protein
MQTSKQKALEEVTKRLVDGVKKEIDEHGSPYDYEKRFDEIWDGGK